jgi:steroid 5-alpha reductase family enzyme
MLRGTDDVFQILWCVRLTYHTARRGLYSLYAASFSQAPVTDSPLSNEEDYRYTQWRKMVPAWFFQIFSFFFICKC